jgi:hypothetical protein
MWDKDESLYCKLGLINLIKKQEKMNCHRYNFEFIGIILSLLGSFWVYCLFQRMDKFWIIKVQARYSKLKDNWTHFSLSKNDS